MRLLVLFFSLSLFYRAQAQPLYNSAIYLQKNVLGNMFAFGVASGDPSSNSVVLWTKLNWKYTSDVQVQWEIAEDTAMQQIVTKGVKFANMESAFTVKFKVEDLQPGKTYFYRFLAKDQYSPIGRTKTAPTNGASKLKFAVVSCNNYQHGYFNAYRLIANRCDIDAVIHLGDYIYEYGVNRTGKKPQIRDHIPEHEILTLVDYRSRYAQYRLDEDLQEAHRLHPFIAVWDDHEFANNTYKDGAQNHQAAEGEWEERKKCARQVYFEWLPIADNDSLSIIRKLNYGDLAEVFMLDGRVEGRDKQLEHPNELAQAGIDRTMIGKLQADWLVRGLVESKAKWKVMGNQVMFSELDMHKLSKKYARNLDAWDGYPSERNKLLNDMYTANLKNILVLTGDIHTSFGLDLVRHPQDKTSYNRKTGKGVIGAEIVTPSVSSSNLDERIPRGLAKLVGKLVKDKKTNPHMKYNNLVDHGYVLLQLSAKDAVATWVYCKTVKENRADMRKSKSWITKYDANHLTKYRP